MQYSDIFRPIIPGAQEKIIWQQLAGSSVGLAISIADSEAKQPILVITEDSLLAERLMDELYFFTPPPGKQIYFPDRETLPYDYFSPHQDITSDRLAALYHLPTIQNGVIITTVTTLMHYLPPKHYLHQSSFVLKTGDNINTDILKTELIQAGYHLVSQVREHGEFSLRGSLIDLFPMGSREPFRIDLFDQAVESIRYFSPDTQRSKDKIDEIRLLPAKEFPITTAAIEKFRQNWRQQFAGNPLNSSIYQEMSEGICPPGIEYYLPFFYDQLNTLFDYLPKNTLIITVGETETKSHEYHQEIIRRYVQTKHDVQRPIIPPEQLFLSPNDINRSLSNYSHIQINLTEKKLTKKTVLFDTTSAPLINLQKLADFLSQHTNKKILFCAETLGRRENLLQLFRQTTIQPVFFNTWQDFLNSTANIGLVIAPLDEGFQLNTPLLLVIAESELYGKKMMQRRLRKKAAQESDAFIRDLTEMQLGDAVVHIDHGIGYYRGLQTLTVGEQSNEFLCLEYEAQAKLYVPVSSLHLISRYTHSNNDPIPLSRLGTGEWARTKRKALEKIRDTAAELLALYAKRASRPGHRYQIPTDAYAKFAADFPFEETPDQLRAIEQVFEDMCSDKPMDRVICGDVGFGKTEVAMRATFLTVLNGKQTVVLVPTTLLAQQHYQNFQDRFADWPVQVEMLSRFRTAKEQKNILARMENGQIDIVIGTHKLLQNDIKLKSLGLVIIDEEHRFGVRQKEKLKALRTSVDILTLTATPIPRTLNMALSGIRDLSIIATPPSRRLAVKTFLHEYKENIIQEAISREIFRGGQVYFLHNDIATIDKKAEMISDLVKEARPTIAHGQMHERELEKIMSDFYHRRYNVLICSTIIESGIDIPTANTIIINRADKFGIAQLHQLRGRVGRSHHQAYAYLLVPSRESLSSDALKRLEAITAFDNLGIGFTLATHDLEIRGTGELLGEEQSGNMEQLGFTLYMDLLSRTIEALKQGETLDLEQSLLNHRAEVDLSISALIPADYLSDVPLRLQCYKRIANAKSERELDEIQIEMIDRFGLLPASLKNLFAISALKQKADELGIIKIEANETGGKLTFNERPHIKPEILIQLLQTKPAYFRLEGSTKLRFVLDAHQANDRIILVDTLLDQLREI